MLSNFKNKGKSDPKKRLVWAVAGIFVLIIFIALIIGNIRIYQKKKEFLSQIASLQNQIKDLQGRNSDLKEGISQVNDPQYIEKVAREQLDLQKPGEKTVSFVVSKDESQKADAPKTNTIQGWFSNVWSWITGKK